MNWFERLQETLRYIEENIREDLDLKVISELVFASEFHFQRMFFAVTDMSFWDYIRKRRLSLAASDLIQTDKKIIDIALEYHYGSPEAFSRAFRAVHGITPTQARQRGVTLIAVPPLSIQVSIKGEKQMEYRLEKKDAFKIKGVSTRVSTKNGENFKVIPEFWDKVMQDGTFKKLMESTDKEINYGVCMNFDESMQSFDYAIGVNDIGQEEFEGIDVPASTWAVFTSTGKLPNAIQALTKRIFNEWFPATDFKHTKGPELEVFLPGDQTKEDYKCEVWIPVAKSQ